MQYRPGRLRPMKPMSDRKPIAQWELTFGMQLAPPRTAILEWTRYDFCSDQTQLMLTHWNDQPHGNWEYGGYVGSWRQPLADDYAPTKWRAALASTIKNYVDGIEVEPTEPVILALSVDRES